MFFLIADKISVVMFRIKQHGVDLISIDPKFNYMCAQKDGGCAKGTRVIKGKKPSKPSLRRRNEPTKMPRLKQRCGLGNAIQLSVRRSLDSDVDAHIKCCGPASGTHRRTRRRAPGAAAWEEFREIFFPQLVYFTPFEWRVACQRRHKCKRWVV